MSERGRVCGSGGEAIQFNRRTLVLAGAAGLAGVAAFSPGTQTLWGDDSPAAPLDKDAHKTYSRSIAAAQQSLDSGKLDDARKQLDATPAKLRGFEFHYLTARLAQGKMGEPAPDLLQKVGKPEVEVRYAVLHAATRHIVYICRDGALRRVNLTKPTETLDPLPHPEKSPVWTGVFSHDGSRFFAGHQSGEVVVWNAKTWQVERTVRVSDDWPVRELAASPDGQAFIAESKEAIELWSLREDQSAKIAAVGQRLNFGEGVAFSPQGDLIATGGMFDIQLLDAKTGQPKRSMRHASYTMGLEFSPDGRRIASAPRGNVNKFLAVFGVDREEPDFNAGPFGHYIAGMSFSPDGQRIAATGCEKLFRIFDSHTGDIALALKRKECGAKPGFSSDGRLLGWNEPDGFYFIDLGPAATS